jgi:hypothetical protein
MTVDTKAVRERAALIRPHLERQLRVAEMCNEQWHERAQKTLWLCDTLLTVLDETEAARSCDAAAMLVADAAMLVADMCVEHIRKLGTSCPLCGDTDDHAEQVRREEPEDWCPVAAWEAVRGEGP